MPKYQFAPDQYDPQVVSTLINTGRKRGLSEDHILAALSTGIVESGLRNLDRGHGTSVGWRQEVKKYYGSKERRMDVQGATNRFYDELEAAPRKGSVGMWSQAVQRSAYPERYDQALPVARQVLQHFGGDGGQGGQRMAAAGSNVEAIDDDGGGVALPVRQESRDMWRNILQAMSNRVAGRPTNAGVGAESVAVGVEGVVSPEDSLRQLYSRYGGQGIVPHEPYESEGEAQEAAAQSERQLTPEEAEQLYQESRKSGHGWGGHQNGRIPEDQMTDLGGGQKLESTAAHNWNLMVAAAKADGVDISLTDSYRDYAGQVSVRKRKGHKVATAKPGTSVHGWGKAVDVGNGREWIQQNGHRWGWVWPSWAQTPGTKSYEPWHFEFVGG